MQGTHAGRRVGETMSHAPRPWSSKSVLSALVLMLGPTIYAGCSDGGQPSLGGTGGALGTGGLSSGGDQGAGGAPSASGGAGDVAGDGGSSSSAGGAPATGGGSAAGGSGNGAVTPFRVTGAKLFDRCGEEVVLRGVNEMIVWSSGRDGDPEFSEIAKTGANAVRIVWNEEGSAAELDVAIGNALAQGLIPMIEHHSATGDLTLLPTVVDYWVSPDVVAVIKKHEANLLLNIANESGDNGVDAAEFQAAYQTAITRIRETGVVLPLIIDAPSWGQNINVLQETWQQLVVHDPEQNLMFSVHMWWDDPDGTRVIDELSQSVEAGMPLIVGEFAQHAVSGCADAPFAYPILLDEAQKAGIGWLAWSWGGVENADCADEGAFDMTVDGVFGDWKEPWGEEVALTHPASIQNTSVRPASILTGQCP